MRKVLSCALILSSFCFFSCQKEVDFDDPSQPGGNPNTDSRNSYHPVTIGSTWTFKDTATGTQTTGIMVNVVKTINSVLYTAYTGSSGSTKDTAWIASPQPNYFMAAKGVSPNNGAAYELLFHYLNDTASVGYNWQYSAGQGNGFNAYIKTTIVERNKTMTVEGKTYNNVIHTNLLFSYNIFGDILEFASYDYFIAKGVGIIKVRTEINNFGISLKACTNLLAYSIK
jgi:hypothetical protein